MRKLFKNFIEYFYKQPKVGEIWGYKNANPFKNNITYEVLELKDDYIKYKRMYDGFECIGSSSITYFKVGTRKIK
jgi:hypothetical protein